jgi:hypothetical protein
MLLGPSHDLLPFQLFSQSREQVVVRRIGWVIKMMEAQVDQFLLVCNCQVSRFLPDWPKDLSAPLYLYPHQNYTEPFGKRDSGREPELH